MSAKQYRPYLSHPAIKEIIRCLETAPTTSLSLLTYLRQYEFKISQELLQPQNTLAPSLSERLGESSLQGATPKKSPAELFKQWQDNPGSILPSEFQLVQQYRWEQGFMTPLESAQYEAALFGSSS